jgi:hypothetical protein
VTIVNAPSGLGSVHPRPVQHGRREVDAGGVADHPGERADDEAGATGDVEHGVLGAGAAELHQQTQRRLVLDHRRRRERHRLPRELIEDRLAIVRLGHGARRG